MTIKANTFEGQSSGTTWSTANSGGGSGDAFDTLTVTGSPTGIYDNAQKSHGSNSLHITVAASATYLVRWTTFNGNPLAFRFYLRIAAASAAQDLVSIRNSGAQASGIGMTSGRVLNVKNSAGTTLSTFTTALALNTWYRIEIQTTKGTTTSNGTIAVQYYAGDSLTPVETGYSSSAVNAGTTNLTEVRFGKLTSATATLEAYFDSAAANDATATPLGPPLTTVTDTHSTTWATRARVTDTHATTWATRQQVTNARPPLLVDGFDGALDLWPASTAAIIVAGRARVTCNTITNGLKSRTGYCYQSGSLSAQVFPPAAGGAVTQASVGMRIESGTSGTFLSIEADRVTGNIIFASKAAFSDGAQVSITYSPTTHAWWQISESAGTVTWATSLDGATWTTRRTATTPAWMATPTQFVNFAVKRDSGTVDYAEVDNVASNDTTPGANAIWAVRARVTDTATTSWDVLAGTTTVGQTIATTWAVRQRVPDTAATAWAVRSAVTDSAVTSWAVRSAVTPKTAATTWGVRSRTTDTAVTSWAVRARVTDTTATTWAARVTVTDSAATVWAVRAAVTPKTAATSWAVRQQVSDSAATTWAVRGRITKTGATTWAARGAVVDSAVTTWAVRVRVTDTAVTTWVTAQRVADSAVTSWAVRTRVLDSAATSWATRGRVSKTAATSWDVAGVLAQVLKSAATSWATKARALNSAATSWSVRSAATDNVGTTWDVRARVTDTAATAWDVRARVTDTAPAGWAVRVPVVQSAGAAWAVLQRVTADESTSWDVLAIFYANVPRHPVAVITSTTRGATLTGVVGGATLTTDRFGAQLAGATRTATITAHNRKATL